MMDQAIQPTKYVTEREWFKIMYEREIGPPPDKSKATKKKEVLQALEKKVARPVKDAENAHPVCLKDENLLKLEWKEAPTMKYCSCPMTKCICNVNKLLEEQYIPKGTPYPLPLMEKVKNYFRKTTKPSGRFFEKLTLAVKTEIAVTRAMQERGIYEEIGPEYCLSACQKFYLPDKTKKSDDDDSDLNYVAEKRVMRDEFQKLQEGYEAHGGDLTDTDINNATIYESFTDMTEKSRSDFHMPKRKLPTCTIVQRPGDKLMSQYDLNLDKKQLRKDIKERKKEDKKMKQLENRLRKQQKQEKKAEEDNIKRQQKEKKEKEREIKKKIVFEHKKIAKQTRQQNQSDTKIFVAPTISKSFEQSLNNSPCDNETCFNKHSSDDDTRSTETRLKRGSPKTIKKTNKSKNQKNYIHAADDSSSNESCKNNDTGISKICDIFKDTTRFCAGCQDTGTKSGVPKTTKKVKSSKKTKSLEASRPSSSMSTSGSHETRLNNSPCDDDTCFNKYLNDNIKTKKKHRTGNIKSPDGKNKKTEKKKRELKAASTCELCDKVKDASSDKGSLLTTKKIKSSKKQKKSKHISKDLNSCECVNKNSTITKICDTCKDATSFCDPCPHTIIDTKSEKGSLKTVKKPKSSKNKKKSTHVKKSKSKTSSESTRSSSSSSIKRLHELSLNNSPCSDDSCFKKHLNDDERTANKSKTANIKKADGKDNKNNKKQNKEKAIKANSICDPCDKVKDSSSDKSSPKKSKKIKKSKKQKLSKHVSKKANSCECVNKNSVKNKICEECKDSSIFCDPCPHAVIDTISDKGLLKTVKKPKSSKKKKKSTHVKKSKSKTSSESTRSSSSSSIKRLREPRLNNSPCGDDTCFKKHLNDDKKTFNKSRIVKKADGKDNKNNKKQNKEKAIKATSICDPCDKVKDSSSDKSSPKKSKKIKKSKKQKLSKHVSKKANSCECVNKNSAKNKICDECKDSSIFCDPCPHAVIDTISDKDLHKTEKKPKSSKKKKKSTHVKKSNSKTSSKSTRSSSSSSKTLLTTKKIKSSKKQKKSKHISKDLKSCECVNKNSTITKICDTCKDATSFCDPCPHTIIDTKSEKGSLKTVKKPKSSKNKKKSTHVKKSKSKTSSESTRSSSSSLIKRLHELSLNNSPCGDDTCFKKHLNDDKKTVNKSRIVNIKNPDGKDNKSNKKQNKEKAIKAKISKHDSNDGNSWECVNKNSALSKFYDLFKDTSSFFNPCRYIVTGKNIDDTIAKRSFIYDLKPLKRIRYLPCPNLNSSSSNSLEKEKSATSLKPFSAKKVKNIDGPYKINTTGEKKQKNNDKNKKKDKNHSNPLSGDLSCFSFSSENVNNKIKKRDRKDKRKTKDAIKPYSQSSVVTVNSDSRVKIMRKPQKKKEIISSNTFNKTTDPKTPFTQNKSNPSKIRDNDQYLPKHANSVNAEYLNKNRNIESGKISNDSCNTSKNASKNVGFVNIYNNKSSEISKKPVGNKNKKDYTTFSLSKLKNILNKAATKIKNTKQEYEDSLSNYSDAEHKKTCTFPTYATVKSLVENSFSPCINNSITLNCSKKTDILKSTISHDYNISTHKQSKTNMRYLKRSGGIPRLSVTSTAKSKIADDFNDVNAICETEDIESTRYSIKRTIRSAKGIPFIHKSLKLFQNSSSCNTTNETNVKVSKKKQVPKTIDKSFHNYQLMTLTSKSIPNLSGTSRKWCATNICPISKESVPRSHQTLRGDDSSGYSESSNKSYSVNKLEVFKVLSFS